MLVIVGLRSLLHHLNRRVIILRGHISLRFLEQSVEIADLRVFFLDLGVFLIDLFNLLLLFFGQLGLSLLFAGWRRRSLRRLLSCRSRSEIDVELVHFEIE